MAFYVIFIYIENWLCIIWYFIWILKHRTAWQYRFLNWFVHLILICLFGQWKATLIGLFLFFIYYFEIAIIYIADSTKIFLSGCLLLHWAVVSARCRPKLIQWLFDSIDCCFSINFVEVVLSVLINLGFRVQKIDSSLSLRVIQLNMAVAGYLLTWGVRATFHHIWLLSKSLINLTVCVSWVLILRGLWWRLW